MRARTIRSWGQTAEATTTEEDKKSAAQLEQDAQIDDAVEKDEGVVYVL